MPSRTVIEEIKFTPGNLRKSPAACVFVFLRFKAISSCPDFKPSSERGTPLPVTSCDAIPPGGYYASADKMFHRHLLLGSAFLIPQACLHIKAQPLSREAEAFYANCGRKRLPVGCPTPTRRGWSALVTPAIKGTRCTSSVGKIELKQARSLNHYC